VSLLNADKLGFRVVLSPAYFYCMPLRASVTKFFLLSTREYTREGTRPCRVLGELI
jgi:hypothetical protein